MRETTEKVACKLGLGGQEGFADSYAGMSDHLDFSMYVFTN